MAIIHMLSVCRGRDNVVNSKFQSIEYRTFMNGPEQLLTLELFVSTHKPAIISTTPTKIKPPSRPKSQTVLGYYRLPRESEPYKNSEYQGEVLEWAC